MRSVRILAVAVVCLVAACAKGDKSDAADSAARADSAMRAASASGTGSAGAGAGTAGAVASGCLVGTWKKQDGDFTKTFTFKPDNTGEEVQSRADIRTFKWSMKDANTVHIVNTSQGSANVETDLALDCVNNRFAGDFAK